MSKLFRNCLGIAAGIWFAGSAAFAFSLGDCQVARSFATRVSLTNVPITITATFTNSGTNTLRGMYYVDQIPSALSVSTVRVLLDGVALTNVVVEAGHDGDVYPGCTPWRWRFETPTNFTEASPFLPGGSAQIEYAINCASNGIFSLEQFAWAACAPDRTNVFFGFGEALETRTVKFVGSTNTPLLVGAFSTSGYRLTVDGMPRWPYVISSSVNLHDWLPLATNASPFTFIDTPSAGRFYSAAPYTVTQADVWLEPLASNAWSVLVGGVSNCYYIVEKSADLVNWSAVATNLSPFSFVHTNSGGASAYFRATIALEP